MTFATIKFKGHHCFRDHWSGFEEVKPINVLIGRNNTGKSQLLDFVETLCADRPFRSDWEYDCRAQLSERWLRPHFPDNVTGGTLGGNHWRDHGSKLIGTSIYWKVANDTAREVKLDAPGLLTPARDEVLRRLVKNASHELSGSAFRRLQADRDIRPEVEDTRLDLRPDGSGASNIIRRFLLSTNPKLDRGLISHNLLLALNEVFHEDGIFTEIQVKIHDESSDENYEGKWEVFLGQQTKGLIPLSKSGSGLKTVILVLLNLLVAPRMEGHASGRYTFAFEELENNLHPALLRRLLRYIRSYAVDRNIPMFISTHSSTALDLFGTSDDAQILHVLHDGRSARTQAVSAHFDRLGVVTELGAKPSDLLQANGVVWVEGPSDRVYVNHWISLCSGGTLREGIDYQCAFFGGSVLAKVTFGMEERKDEEELADLLRINPNVVVICDSDKTSRRARLKDRVQRVRREVGQIKSAHIWITSAKEIENYIPGTVLAAVFGVRDLPDPQQFSNFFPRKSARHEAYVTSHLQGRNVDKVKLASLSVRQMKKDEMVSRFDWEAEMKEVVRKIESWNS